MGETQNSKLVSSDCRYSYHVPAEPTYILQSGMIEGFSA
jgi:hypothetical protein